MERLGEMALEDPAGDGRDQLGIGRKRGLNVGREFGPDVVRS
jgi:hypothetical protein